MGRPPTINRERLIDTARRHPSPRRFEAGAVRSGHEERHAARSAGLHPRAAAHRRGENRSPRRAAAHRGGVRPVHPGRARHPHRHRHARVVARHIARAAIRRRRRQSAAPRPEDRLRLLPPRRRGGCHAHRRSARRRAAVHGIAAGLRPLAHRAEDHARGAPGEIHRCAARALDERRHTPFSPAPGGEGRRKGRYSCRQKERPSES